MSNKAAHLEKERNCYLSHYLSRIFYSSCCYVCSHQQAIDKILFSNKSWKKYLLILFLLETSGSRCTICITLCNADIEDEEPRPLLSKKTQKTDEGKYVASSIKLCNNMLQDLKGLMTFLDKRIADPQALSWVDLSFNQLTSIESVSMKKKTAEDCKLCSGWFCSSRLHHKTTHETEQCIV